jgi:hypothetical protein
MFKVLVQQRTPQGQSKRDQPCASPRERCQLLWIVSYNVTVSS